MICGCCELSGTVWAGVFGNEFRESVLMDGNSAGVDRVDHLLIDLDVDHVKTKIVKTGCDGRVDIPASDNADAHIDWWIWGVRRIGCADEKTYYDITVAY